VLNWISSQKEGSTLEQREKAILKSNQNQIKSFFGKKKKG